MPTPDPVICIPVATITPDAKWPEIDRLLSRLTAEETFVCSSCQRDTPNDTPWIFAATVNKDGPEGKRAKVCIVCNDCADYLHLHKGTNEDFIGNIIWNVTEANDAGYYVPNVGHYGPDDTGTGKTHSG